MSPLGTFLRGGTPRPNAAPGLRISLARRLVETPGAPFISHEEVFTDGASALDELGLLPAAQGPTVVRVRVEGGTASERKALAGDWLVDPDAAARIMRLPIPQWTYSNEATSWASARPWLEAWETCQDARWMSRAASQADVDRRLIVLAACACARTALRFVPSVEERPLRAIETAERWARGEVPLEEIRTAAKAAKAAKAAHLAINAAFAAYYAAHAAYAKADTAWAADAVNATADAAADAACAVSAAARATCAIVARAASLARCADLVRREIPTLTVLRAVATAQSQSPGVP